MAPAPASAPAPAPAPPSAPAVQPAPIHRTSPEDSSSSEGVPTPSTTAVEYNPAIRHSNGYVEPQHAAMAAEQTQPVSPPNRMETSKILTRNVQWCAPNQPTNYSVSSAGYPQTAVPPQSQGHDMSRLDALVAAATSENQAATRSY